MHRYLIESALIKWFKNNIMNVSPSLFKLNSYVVNVIKKYITQCLISNNLIQKGQHGFVPGWSTQTHLLAHYKDIYEAMMDGTRIDTVFAA